MLNLSVMQVTEQGRKKQDKGADATAAGIGIYWTSITELHMFMEWLQHAHSVGAHNQWPIVKHGARECMVPNAGV